MHKVSLVTALFAIGLTLPLGSVAAAPAVGTASSQSPKVISIQQVRKMIQARDARLQTIQASLAPIKSRMDLNIYLANDRSRTSPFDALSLAARQRFLASLQFSDKGLASFQYTDLENELTPTQIYRILAIFGMQHDIYMFKAAPKMTKLDRVIMGGQSNTVGDQSNSRGTAKPMWLSPVRGIGDHQDYYCMKDDPHTCARYPGDICTSNC